jgi:hypothetical protein
LKPAARQSATNDRNNLLKTQPQDLHMVEEMLVRWTARLAVSCYVARLMCDAEYRRTTLSPQSARWWWTIGCGWFVMHVIAAFHFEHGWSHSSAFESTARKTAAMTGWNSGWGLYINEAFLCLWITDTILWWRNLSWPDNRRIYWAIQGIFAFLMIQATAIFGPLFWKPVVLLVVVILWIRVLRSRQIRH